jgi:hypothetical protein
MTNRKAFSFVEIMIAVVIMVVGILPVYFLLTSGTRGIRLGLYEVLAVNHASSVMELLRGFQHHEIMRDLYPQGADSAEVEQSGWVVYSREEKGMQDSGTDGSWFVSAGADGRMKDFFNKWLSPEILPPLEVYFDRRVNLSCNDLYCVIKVEVGWKEEGKSSIGAASRRSVDLRTVVVGAH